MKTIRASGVEFKHLPPELKDTVLAKSPKDKLGQVTLKKFSGVQTSPAAIILRNFKKQIPSWGDLIEKLEASDKLGEAERKFIELVEAAPSRSLPRLVAEAGVRPSRLLKLYAEGAIALGKVQAAIEVSRNQPALVKDLLRNALDQQGACRICLGTGKVKKKATSVKEEKDCPLCNGSGVRLVASKHKEFAVEKVLELGKLTEPSGKGSAVNVNVQQNNVVGGGGAFFSKVLKSTDEILYRQRFKELPTGGGVENEVAEPVVEAEVVSGSRASSEGSGGDGRGSSEPTLQGASLNELDGQGAVAATPRS